MQYIQTNSPDAMTSKGKSKADDGKWELNNLPSNRENYYPTFSLVNQILGKWGPMIYFSKLYPFTS